MHPIPRFLTPKFARPRRTDRPNVGENTAPGRHPQRRRVDRRAPARTYSASIPAHRPIDVSLLPRRLRRKGPAPQKKSDLDPSTSKAHIVLVDDVLYTAPPARRSTRCSTTVARQGRAGVLDRGGRELPVAVPCTWDVTLADGARAGTRTTTACAFDVLDHEWGRIAATRSSTPTASSPTC